MTSPHPPKEVRITVRVTDVTAETFVFESNDITVGPNNHLTFDNGAGHSGFDIHYELAGADGYRFFEEPDDALWVKVGSKTHCPQTKSGWGQFKAVEVKDAAGPDGEKRILRVRNKNETQRDFSYTLRATKGSGAPLILDPGGTNNNGGFDQPMFSNNVIVGAVATVAVVAVLFFAFR